MKEVEFDGTGFVLEYDGVRMVAVEPADDEDSRTQPLVQVYCTVYSRLFRDAFGRLAARKDRTLADFSRTFEPLLYTIAEEFARQLMADQGRVKAIPTSEFGPFIKKHVEGMHLRCNELSKATVDQISRDETALAVASLESLVSREIDN